MATIEEEAPGLVHESSYVVISRKVRASAGADDKLALRSIVALIVVVMVSALAPVPWALFGVAASTILAIELARTAWTHK